LPFPSPWFGTPETVEVGEGVSFVFNKALCRIAVGDVDSREDEVAQILKPVEDAAAVPAGRGQSPAQGGIDTWEYLMVESPSPIGSDDKCRADWMAVLNRLGAQGWELLSNGFRPQTLCFKRRKPAAAQ